MKTTRTHKSYWKKRKIDWISAYLNPTHPHRAIIVEKMARFRPIGSVFEIGCGAGANLYLIKKLNPKIQVGGIDINEDAIKTARQALGVNPEFFEVGSYDKIFAGDGSTDIVLTDMALIYADHRTALKTLKEAKRIARKGIVLCEFHSESFIKRKGLWLASGYYSYNYKKLLEDAGFFDPEFYQLTEQDWEGVRQEGNFRWIITAKS